MEQLSQHNISIKQIQVLKFFLEEKDEHFNANDIRCNIQIERKLMVKPADVLFIIAMVDFLSNEKEKMYASIKLAIAYSIEDMNNTLQINDTNKTFTIPTLIDTILQSVSVSTLRGFAWAKLMGTYLHNNVIPLVTITGINQTNPNTIQPI
jgi:hypothetical protein